MGWMAFSDGAASMKTGGGCEGGGMGGGGLCNNGGAIAGAAKGIIITYTQ